MDVVDDRMKILKINTLSIFVHTRTQFLVSLGGGIYWF